MYKIIKRKQLNPTVILTEIEAPYIAMKGLAGQFVIIRVHGQGERIPLTIADCNPENGGVTVIYQVVGRTTALLSALNEGESIVDITGPLGMPSKLDGYKKACVIGGGVGTAIAYPSAKALFKSGADVDVIAGFRNKELVILENELKEVCGKLIITTDDGSYGRKGFVTDCLKAQIENGNKYELVIAIGPVPMMRAVCETTRSYGIKTLVSLNPIMIDGTGMCGCCRVTVGGETRFACVDGPEFDGHKVDFDGLMLRNSAYHEQEKHSAENCRLFNIK